MLMSAIRPLLPIYTSYFILVHLPRCFRFSSCLCSLFLSKKNKTNKPVNVVNYDLNKISSQDSGSMLLSLGFLQKPCSEDIKDRTLALLST